MRGRRSIILGSYETELRAETLEDVRDVLRSAEAAARRGLWVGGFVSYEAAPAFDPGLAVRCDAAPAVDVPLAWFGLFRSAAATPLKLPHGARRTDDVEWDVEMPREEYALRVKSILDEIEMGNAYQVNLTSHLTSRAAVDSRDLYRRLLHAQQPAHAALIELDDVAVVSASPELFFEWDTTTLRSRPMKGTMRRGRWTVEDEAKGQELATSPKDRAENVMIVDLIRNDLSKVARTGSVKVSALCELEAYPHVWQMVSDVSCTTRDDVGVIDIFDAMFPCGSVTGAPKQSAMGVIASLETAPRGLYCGAVGLMAPSRSGVRAKFNVAIRTAVIERARGTASFGSGGGVVADSSPEGEYRELVLKSDMLNSPVGQPIRLLETFRYTPGGANDHVDEHLARLRGSAEFLGFRLRDGLDTYLASRLVNASESRVRLLLSRNGRLDVQVTVAPDAPTKPVRLAIDDEAVDSQWVMLFHKTTRRGVYTRRRRRHRSVDDVIMVNERGECTETTTANIAVLVGSQWLTPALASGCLPGVERARRIKSGELVEARLTPDDVRSAVAVAVLNSLRGWRDAVVVDLAGRSSSREVN
ncbi:MAG TPA: chorismate-binding protein [Acidimicrobiales bacterium]|nr:chorismate-binding protein [Acidimicrobiales bacterium]